jgi:uncharacterized membrane protein YeaQ/YmgE (transglycosylase-associated protein family)
MGYITWIVAGALLGGAASALTRTRDRRARAVDIAAGIGGVMSGGWLLGMLIGASAFEPGVSSLGCLLVSLLGAAVLIGVLHEGRRIRFLNEKIAMKLTLRAGGALRPLIATGIAGVLVLAGACALVSM